MLDDFGTPPTFPRLISSANSSATTITTSQRTPEVIDLDMDDSSNSSGDQLADRLEALERMKSKMDKAYDQQKKQLFNDIEQCELGAGKKVQHQLLNAFKQWISLTTENEPSKEKPHTGKKLTTLQELVNGSRSPKKVDEKPPNTLEHKGHFVGSYQQFEISDQGDVDADMVINGFDSKQLAEMIQRVWSRPMSTLTEDDLRYIDRLRRQLASQRKGDLENTLNNTPYAADRQRLTALLEQGALHHTLQAAMQQAEDENPPTMLPSISTMPKESKYDSTLSSSRNVSNAMPTNSLVERPSTKKRPSSTGTLASTPETSSSTRRKSVATQDSFTPTARTSSSAAHDTASAQKFICQTELDGGICNDGACDAAHFRDYEVTRS